MRPSTRVRHPWRGSTGSSVASCVSTALAIPTPRPKSATSTSSGRHWPKRVHDTTGSLTVRPFSYWKPTVATVRAPTGRASSASAPTPVSRRYAKGSPRRSLYTDSSGATGSPKNVLLASDSPA